MTRESMARWLAAATTVLVVLLAALFALLHNLQAPPEAAPAAAQPPALAAAEAPPAPSPAVPVPPVTTPEPLVPPLAVPVAPRPPLAADAPQPAPRPVAPPPAPRPAPAPPAALPVPAEAAPAPPPAAVPVPDPARIAAGQRAYERMGCAMCHSIGGRGNPASPLDGVGARLDRQALHELTTGTGVAGAALGAGLARRKQRAVNDPEMDVLLDYLEQLR